MKLTGRVKPVSYLKAHAADVIRELSEGAEPLIVTQRGEAKAVVMDIASYEKTQETLAFLKILALGDKAVAAGRTVPVDEAFAKIRRRRKT